MDRARANMCRLLGATVVAVACLAVAVAGAGAAAQDSLVVAKGGSGTGTVTSSPPGINCGTTCTHDFNDGSMVTLTATPNGTSRFSGWSGGFCAGSSPTCTVTMQSGISATATFIATPTLKVVKTGTGSGTVTSSPAGISCGLDCSQAYDQGTKVTLTAAAAPGSRFAGWAGGGCPKTASSCIVTVVQATQVNARFNRLVELSITKSGSGTGTVVSAPSRINCGKTCAAFFDLGTKVRLAARPARGSRFMGWSGAGCTGMLPCTFTLSETSAVNAEFARVVVAPSTRITRVVVKRKRHHRRGKVKVFFAGSRGTGSLHFKCKLGHRRYKPCTSPHTFRHVKKGRHTIKVVAIDSLGVADPTPAKAIIRVR